MKGLLLKDFYMFWSYYKILLLMIVIFAVLSLSDIATSFYLIYPVVLGSLLPVTLISYEERCKWTVYCQTTPVSRKMVVIEKYVLAGLCSLFILTITALIQFIVFSRAVSFVWREYLNMLQSLFFLSVLGPSFTLPLIFKFGSEKGRLAYYFMIGIACAVSVIFGDRKFAVLPMSAPAALVLGVIIFVGSCLLSVSFYKKRQL